jgi:hypothetical protein
METFIRKGLRLKAVAFVKISTESIHLFLPDCADPE